METRSIGSLKVSVIGLGCNNFGMRLDAARTDAVVGAALDAGINFFDTADVYGGSNSEVFLGQALKGKRDQAIIASKFGFEVAPLKKGAKPEYVKDACEASLKRLGIETIDLYQIHTPDLETPIDDTLEALDDLIQEGKVREIGCSNFSVEMLRAAERAARGKSRFVSLQNEYSLFHREPESGTLAECETLSLGFLPYFPLASGVLSGKYRKGQPVPEGTRLSDSRFSGRFLNEVRLEAVEDLLEFAQGCGHTLLELAFAWLLVQPTVSSVIAGATKPEQIAANAKAASWHFSDADLEEVNAILERYPEAQS